MRQDRISDALLPPSSAPAPRLGHALLWSPQYVRDDKILWHVPFIFWLIEAIRPRQYVEIGVGEGVAYMAVCQALHRTRAHAKCYAVGQWQDHDGKICVPERLAARNADLYEDFSKILTDGIEKSAEAIDEASVDLMLVDLAQDPAVAPFLQQIWLPKLSSTGILLLNGVSREDPTISVLIDALSGKSPTIQLPGGDGLLVVLPGRGPDEELANIAALSPDDPAHKLVVQMFTRLGAGAYHEVHARQDADRRDTLDEQIQRLTVERDSLAAQLEQRDRQYDSRHHKVAILQSRCFDLEIASEAARSDTKRVLEELSVVRAEKENAYGLFEREQTAHRLAQDQLQRTVAEAESLKEDATLLRTDVAELTAQAENAARHRQRLSEELDSERAKRGESFELLQAEREARESVERELDKTLAKAESLEGRVTELTLSASDYYQTVKGLIAALEENENLLTALMDELRSEKLQRGETAREVEQARPLEGQRGVGGLLNLIIGRKHE